MKKLILILVLFLGLMQAVSAQETNEVFLTINANELLSMVNLKGETYFNRLSMPTVLFLNNPENLKSLRMQSELKKYSMLHPECQFLEFDSKQDSEERHLKDILGYRFYPTVILISPEGGIYYSFSGFYEMYEFSLIFQCFFGGQKAEEETGFNQISLFNTPLYYGDFDLNKSGNGVVVNPNGVKFMGKVVNGLAFNGIFYEFLAEGKLQTTWISNGEIIKVNF